MDRNIKDISIDDRIEWQRDVVDETIFKVWCRRIDKIANESRGSKNNGTNKPVGWTGILRV